MYTDFLTRIMNGQRAKKEYVKIAFSNFTFAIAELLAREEYVASVAKKGRLPKRTIEIKLKYDDAGKGVIQGAKFMSKSSHRRYIRYRELNLVKQGYGMAIISTPKGIMTGREARRAKVGGELLFEIW